MPKPLSKPKDVIEPERQQNEDDFVPDMWAWLQEQSSRIGRDMSFTRIEPHQTFWDNEDVVLVGALSAWLLSFTEAAISEQVSNVLTPAGLGLDANVNARAAAWANNHALELAKGLNTTTRDLAKQRLVNWLQSASQDGRVLEKSLAQIIAPKWRAEMIAQTEVTRAWSEARQQIANETEVIKGLAWSTAMDERVCPICEPLNGRMRGKNGLYPGAQTPPPAHPRCRCGEVYTI